MGGAMSFTEAEIEHTFKNADLTAGSGSVTFTLTKRMTNSGVTIVPATITANLNSEGKLAQKLTANDDTGTVPEDVQWRVDFRVLGDQADTFYIRVPSGGGKVDLGSLLPDQPTGG